MTDDRIIHNPTALASQKWQRIAAQIEPLFLEHEAAGRKIRITIHAKSGQTANVEIATWIDDIK